MTPSTEWREQIGEGEDQRYAAAAERLAEIQRVRSARFGPGRALHRKQLLGLRATLEVLPNLPAHAAHGLFAEAGRYEARVRLSNGGMEVASDKKPDIRGYAIKVLGVKGEGTFGGPAPSQDFLLINQPTFGFSGPDAFFALIEAAARGVPSVLWHFVKTHGLIDGLRRVAALQAAQSKPFAGFAAAPFFSAAPIACGPYAARVRLVPEESPADAPPVRADDLTADVIARLARGHIGHRLQLQFFVDESRTPIEDGAVDWAESDAPYVDVARLIVAQQDPASVEGQALVEELAQAKLDPWSALAAHRPLGAIMRARKVAYLVSQKGRGVA